MILKGKEKPITMYLFDSANGVQEDGRGIHIYMYIYIHIYIYINI
jgi:hypothetical protein